MKTLVVTLLDGTTEEFTVGASRNSLGLCWDYTVIDAVLAIIQGDEQINYPLVGIRKWVVK